MRLIGRNVLANLVGQGWAAALQFLFIPVYLRFLGVEAFGLIGFYATLVSLFQALDLGLSPTLNRELARGKALGVPGGDLRNLVRTIEIACLGIGAAIALIILAGSSQLSTRWMHPVILSAGSVREAICWMGGVIALQWVLGFYLAGLMGLEHQLTLNGIRVALASFSTGGAALILWKVSPTITAFFKWQLLVSLLGTAAARALLWKGLPAASRPARIDLGVVPRVWRFTAGMGVVTVTGIVLTQYDRFFLSKLLSLSDYGCYMLATVWASGLLVLFLPVYSATLPRFSAVYARREKSEFSTLYHQTTQAIAFLVFPIAAVIAFFSHSILFLWLRDEAIATAGAPILTLLVTGMALHGVLHVTSAIQVAAGWTSLMAGLNLLAVIVFVPAIFPVTARFGGVGAAALWLALNLFGLVVAMPLVHRRLLPGQTRRWLLVDVLPPAVVSAGACSIALALGIRGWTGVIPIFLVFLLCAVASGAVSPLVRETLARKFSRASEGQPSA